MVRVNCQNGDGGGSWVGQVGQLDPLKKLKPPVGNHDPWFCPYLDLIGNVSCDSDTYSNRATPMARKTPKSQTLRNRGPFCSPLLPVGSQESVLKVP